MGTVLSFDFSRTRDCAGEATALRLRDLDMLRRRVNVNENAVMVGGAIGDGAAHVRPSDSRGGWFASAVRKCQVLDSTFERITPHYLRHTTASLAVSAGANVKAVQRMLGHASATLTLDTYADLFGDDLDAVAIAVDHTAAAPSVGKMWANGS